jgi:hypothetical protein
MGHPARDEGMAGAKAPFFSMRSFRGLKASAPSVEANEAVEANEGTRQEMEISF